jgi:hypothetical protein
MRVRRRVALLLGASLLAGTGASAVVTAGAAQAASVRYVATNGDDANPGTLARPYATIGKAMSVARPGDVVNVRGGVYRPSAATWFSTAGTPSARIVLRSHPGERAVIDAGGQPWGTDGLGTGGSYLDIVGLEVRNASRIGINVWGGHHIRIVANRVHSNRDAGIFMGYDRRGVTSHVVVSRNDVYNNALVNAGVQGAHPGIVLAMRASHIVVDANRVRQNYGEGIDFVMADHVTATRNVVYDNYAAGIYLDNATDAAISRNLVYTTGDKRFFWMGHPASGIHVANEYYDVYLPSDRNTITNNIVIGGRWGFYYGSYQRGGGLRGTLVANNTFYKATGSMINIDADSGHARSAIRNNVFRQVGGAAMGTVARLRGVTFSNNAWHGGTRPATAAGRGDLGADCRFVAPGRFTPAAYALRAGSPCVDRGYWLAAVPRDYYGVLRGARPDIGAVERR